MSRKLYLVLVAMIITLLVVSCSRSASSSSTLPTATKNTLATPGTNAPGGNATEDPMALVKLFATQTAMAGGQTGAGFPTATPTVGNPLLGGTAITPQGSPASTSLVPSTGVPITPGLPSGTPLILTPYPTTTKPTTYTLQPGEFLFCIARRFNVDPNELMTSNGLNENSLLQPGLVLNIPQSGSTFPGARARVSHPATYRVAVNDTIYSIGCYYGDVDPLAIAAVNHLSPPYNLSTGQSLSIP